MKSLEILVLFDLFDFNELNSLSAVDIEFMLHCCLSSTFKIYSMSAEINDTELGKFIAESFKDDERINITNLMK